MSLDSLLLTPLHCSRVILYYFHLLNAAFLTVPGFIAGWLLQAICCVTANVKECNFVRPMRPFGLMKTAGDAHTESEITHTALLLSHWPLKSPIPGSESFSSAPADVWVGHR